MVFETRREGKQRKLKRTLYMRESEAGLDEKAEPGSREAEAYRAERIIWSSKT